MMRCEKCRVNVRSGGNICPLCQSHIHGEPEEEVFPKIPSVYSQFTLFFKILIWATVSGAIISVALNLMLKGGGWSLFVTLGVVCFWLILYIAVRKRNNIPKNISYLVFMIGVISVVWDAVTGWRGWSIDFVIPIVCVVAIAALAIVAKILKMPSGDYVFCLLADGLFGIVPFLLYLFKLVHVIYPSIICFTLSLISIVSLLVFDGKNVINGMSKRLHL